MRTRFIHLLSGGICLLFAAGIMLSAKLSTVFAEEGEALAQETSGVLETGMEKTDPSAEVGTEENPLIILEIVPDVSMGMVGYLIPGQEPIDMEALAAAGKDGPGHGTYKSLIVGGGLASEEDSSRYAFEIPEGGVEATDQYASGKWWRMSNEGSAESYTEFGFYRYEGGNKGAFSGSGEGDELQFSYVGEGNGDYSFHMAGFYRYVGGGNGTYARGGAWPDYSYVKKDGGDYEYVEAADAETAGPKDYVRNRSEKSFYRYRYLDITNNDCLVKEVYEGKSTKDGFRSKVITLTPDDLKGDQLKLVETADLIVISAQNYGVALWDALNRDHIEVTPEMQAARKTDFMGPDGMDFSWELVMAVMERMASSNPAALFMEATQMMPENKTSSNVGKLYMMLMQYGAKPFMETFLKDEKHFSVQEIQMNGRNVKTGVYDNPYTQKTWSNEWTNETFLTEHGIHAMHLSEFNRGNSEVFGTIMTYNGNRNMLMDYLQAKVPQLGPDVTETDKWGDNVEAFDYWQKKDPEGKRPDHITTSQGIHYILNRGGKEQPYRKKLRVLEIQPCNRFIYGSFGWQLYYSNLFPWFTGDLTEDLTVTAMTSYQFNGDQADLNSEYDLVVFGKYQDASNGLNGETGYNDKDLSSGKWEILSGEERVLLGKIYTSVGDLVAGAASDPGSEDAAKANARYSGNDITKKKFEELKSFLSASKPIIMPEKFFTKNAFTPAAEWIDQSSYLSKLAAMANDGAKETVLFKEDAWYSKAGNNLLKPALETEQCCIELSEAPQAYGIETKDEKAPGMIAREIYHTLTDGSGRPMFRYRFTLAGTEDRVYAVRLYLDRDGDSVYAGSAKEKQELIAAGKPDTELGSEEAAGIRVAEIGEDGGSAEISADGLKAGKTYEVSYPLQDQERGMLPWKLEVCALDQLAVRSSKTGCTAVKAPDGAKTKINVIQMNLTRDMKTNAPVTVNFADYTTDTGSRFAAYLGAVEDFEVTVTFLENEDWYDQFGMDGDYAEKRGLKGDERKQLLTEKWKEYLEGVDLLILGYAEHAQFTEDEIFYEGFCDFTAQGKGVILSNGIVKDPSIPDDQATLNDAAVRTLAGQRRKYYVDGTGFYRYSKTAINGGKTISLLPGPELLSRNPRYQSTAPTNIPDSQSPEFTAPGASKTDGYYNDYAAEFMDNSTRLLLSYGKNQAVRDRKITENYEISWNGSAKYADWIRLANRGKLTSYPYPIPDSIQISAAFPGSYQLSLEQEDGGDAAVWYNLTDGYDTFVDQNGSGGGIYSSRPGDSANSYYLYNKGNITYTALGMAAGGALTNDELKLFVNTLLGAYRRIPEKPYIKITNGEASYYEGVYTMYHLLTGAEAADGVYEVDFTVCDGDLSAAGQRSYHMRFKDADGMVSKDQPALFDMDSGAFLAYEEEGYPVKRDGNYLFTVPYQTIKDNGEAPLFLELSSVYRRGSKEIKTKRTTRAVIYAMPLFDLS